ncbi:hypothetical protein D3C86_1075830 [compost metagenome]
MEADQQLLLQHHLIPLLLHRLQIEGDPLLLDAAVDQGAPAHSPLVARLFVQGLLVEEPAAVALQPRALEGQLGLFLHLEQGVLCLITDGAEVDGRLQIDRLGPVQPLQALEQLAGAVHHLALGHVGQQHGKDLAGVAGLQGAAVLAHEGADGGARLHQQILARASVQLGIQLLQPRQLDQQDAAADHARLHDGVFQPVVEE